MGQGLELGGKAFVPSQPGESGSRPCQFDSHDLRRPAKHALAVGIEPVAEPYDNAERPLNVCAVSNDDMSATGKPV
jgi:hypothetical protein